MIDYSKFEIITPEQLIQKQKEQQQIDQEALENDIAKALSLINTDLSVCARNSQEWVSRLSSTRGLTKILYNNLDVLKELLMFKGFNVLIEQELAEPETPGSIKGFGSSTLPYIKLTLSIREKDEQK